MHACHTQQEAILSIGSAMTALEFCGAVDHGLHLALPCVVSKHYYTCGSLGLKRCSDYHLAQTDMIENLLHSNSKYIAHYSSGLNVACSNVPELRGWEAAWHLLLAEQFLCTMFRIHSETSTQVAILSPPPPSHTTRKTFLQAGDTMQLPTL